MNRAKVEVVIVGDIAFNTDITPDKKQTSLGGAAYYCAVGAQAAIDSQHLPVRVGVVARVGEDFSLNNLSDKNIDTAGVTVVSGEQTCQFIAVQHPDNTRDFTAERNAASVLDSSPFPAEYEKAHFIHLATSLPQNYLFWLDFLRSHVAGTISADAFELYAQQFPAETVEALNAADMMFLNEAEARLLKPYAHQLRTDTPRLTKFGPQGVSYRDTHSEIMVPAPKVRAVETSGAGDVLAGAFLALLASGHSTKSALQIAVALASQSVTQFGVEHLLKQT